jgi:hypothetical protein
MSAKLYAAAGNSSISSIWDPNSIASPVYCWDEETQQDHRTRTGSNCLVASRWDHHAGDGKTAWQKPIKHFWGAETEQG